ncbi:MAG TPA: hypothetical protein VF062_17555 [Candidatus Limnocylindrales bacterium]
MTWDPFGTIGQALWIGGGQWAGKSTVSRVLAHRHRLTAYHFDYHDARAHNDRRAALGKRLEGVKWLSQTLDEHVAFALDDFTMRFEWVLDDLRALVSGAPIIAEGWGLRPELVAPIAGDARRMVVMVPTEDWRQQQLLALPRASQFASSVDDLEAALRVRVARDRLIAEDAMKSARRLGIRVIEVDGSLDAEAVSDMVAGHFAPYL